MGSPSRPSGGRVPTWGAPDACGVVGTLASSHPRCHPREEGPMAPDLPLDLDGRVALVTGGASGIGAGVCRAAGRRRGAGGRVRHRPRRGVGGGRGDRRPRAALRRERPGRQRGGRRGGCRVVRRAGPRRAECGGGQPGRDARPVRRGRVPACDGRQPRRRGLRAGGGPAGVARPWWGPGRRAGQPRGTRTRADGPRLRREQGGRGQPGAVRRSRAGGCGGSWSTPSARGSPTPRSSIRSAGSSSRPGCR